MKNSRTMSRFLLGAMVFSMVTATPVQAAPSRFYTTLLKGLNYVLSFGTARTVASKVNTAKNVAVKAAKRPVAKVAIGAGGAAAAFKAVNGGGSDYEPVDWQRVVEAPEVAQEVIPVAQPASTAGPSDVKPVQATPVADAAIVEQAGQVVDAATVGTIDSANVTVETANATVPEVAEAASVTVPEVAAETANVTVPEVAAEAAVASKAIPQDVAGVTLYRNPVTSWFGNACNAVANTWSNSDNRGKAIMAGVGAGFLACAAGIAYKALKSRSLSIDELTNQLKELEAYKLNVEKYADDGEEKTDLLSRFSRAINELRKRLALKQFELNKTTPKKVAKRRMSRKQKALAGLGVASVAGLTHIGVSSDGTVAGARSLLAADKNVVKHGLTAGWRFVRDLAKGAWNSGVNTWQGFGTKEKAIAVGGVAAATALAGYGIWKLRASRRMKAALAGMNNEIIRTGTIKTGEKHEDSNNVGRGAEKAGTAEVSEGQTVAPVTPANETDTANESAAAVEEVDFLTALDRELRDLAPYKAAAGTGGQSRTEQNMVVNLDEFTPVADDFRSIAPRGYDKYLEAVDKMITFRNYGEKTEAEAKRLCLELRKAYCVVRRAYALQKHRATQ